MTDPATGVVGTCEVTPAVNAATPTTQQFNLFKYNGGAGWNTFFTNSGANVENAAATTPGTTLNFTPAPGPSSTKDTSITSSCWNVTNRNTGSGVFIPVGSPDEFGSFLSSPVGKSMVGPCAPANPAPIPCVGGVGISWGGNCSGTIPAGNYNTPAANVANTAPGYTGTGGATCDTTTGTWGPGAGACTANPINPNNGNKNTGYSWQQVVMTQNLLEAQATVASNRAGLPATILKVAANANCTSMPGLPPGGVGSSCSASQAISTTGSPNPCYGIDNASSMSGINVNFTGYVCLPNSGAPQCPLVEPGTNWKNPAFPAENGAYWASAGWQTMPQSPNGTQTLWYAQPGQTSGGVGCQLPSVVCGSGWYKFESLTRGGNTGIGCFYPDGVTWLEYDHVDAPAEDLACGRSVYNNPSIAPELMQIDTSKVTPGTYTRKIPCPSGRTETVNFTISAVANSQYFDFTINSDNVQ